MASDQDDAMLDVENVSLGPTMLDPLRSISAPVNGLLVSETRSSPALLNGSLQNSAPSTAADSLASPAKRVQQSSRDSSIPTQDFLENLAFKPASKTEPSSEDLSSEDPGSDMLLPTPGIVVAALPTGLCYDVRMRYHCELDPPKQRLDFHPEDPRRIYYIYKELCKAGLVADANLTTSTVSTPLHKVNIRYATKEEICLVHDAKHFEFVKSTKGNRLMIGHHSNVTVLNQFSDQTEEMLVHLERQYDSIYFNKLTYKSALLSAGGAIETCRAVVTQQVRNAIAVIRPPGHHAECNRPMGFCLFDNVSIAAKVCQQDYPKTCQKIMVFDWCV
jgi:histone deacetylase 6